MKMASLLLYFFPLFSIFVISGILLELFKGIKSEKVRDISEKLLLTNFVLFLIFTSARAWDYPYGILAWLYVILFSAFAVIPDFDSKTR